MASNQKRDPDGDEENQLERGGSLLREALGSYFHEYVCIPVAEQKRAKAVLEKIKQVLIKHLKSSDYAFGVLSHQGSSYEGLKVMREDEFDILVPIKMDSSARWTVCEETAQLNGSSVPGYYLIRKKQNIPTTLDDCIVDGCVDPILTYRKMQSLVQGAVIEMNGVLSGISTALSKNGPALTLNVTYDNTRKLSIDVVPSIELNGIQYVAKRHPKAGNGQSLLTPGQNIYEQLWRRSYSEKEKIIIRDMDWENECRRICLKIIKTVRAKRGASQLGFLSSYHLKTCMLHLNDDTSIGPWHQTYLDVRFKDLLNILIRFLEKRKLPNFYNPSEDLFAQYSHDSLQNILRWLNDIVQSGDQKIIDILLEGRDCVNITTDNFQVFARTTKGNTLPLNGIKKETCVRELKQKIQSKTGIPPSQQLLVCGGRNLNDGHSMGSYGIRNESTIQMTGRLRGG